MALLPDGVTDWFSRWAVLALTILAIAVAAYLFEKVVFRILHLRAEKRGAPLQHAVLEGLHPGLAILLFAALSAYAARKAGFTQTYLDETFLALLVLTAAFTTHRVVKRVFSQKARRQGRWQAAATLGSRLVAALLYVVAALVVLDRFGISITPILASVGIAGLAVALALQDTLSNFFAGIWIQSDRSVQVGHFVRIEDAKVEGHVTEIGWRTSRLRTASGHVVVIPNARLGQSVLTDYQLQSPRLRLTVQVSVDADSDAESVERILLEEARAGTKQIPGLEAEPEPVVHLTGFGATSADFTLALHSREASDQALVQHLLRKRILARLRREGIQMANAPKPADQPVDASVPYKPPRLLKPR